MYLAQMFLVHPESRLSQPNTVPVQPEPTQVSDDIKKRGYIPLL